MKKHITITFVSIFIILIIILIGIIYAYNKSSEQIIVNTDSGQVVIADIYQIGEEVKSENEVIIKTTDYYRLTYFKDVDQFLITIIYDDVFSARSLAEEDLLKYLDINENEACQLNVSVGVPFSYSQEYAGVELGLSFCEGGLPL